MHADLNAFVVAVKTELIEVHRHAPGEIAEPVQKFESVLYQLHDCANEDASMLELEESILKIVRRKATAMTRVDEVVLLLKQFHIKSRGLAS